MYRITMDHPNLGDADPVTLSRHRSLDTARRQARRYVRAVRRANGPGSYPAGLAIRGPSGERVPLTGDDE